MSTLTSPQKRQRLARRRTAVGTAEWRQHRIIVLPATAGSAALNPIERAPSLLRVAPDDLDQATWEDAEWR